MAIICVCKCRQQLRIKDELGGQRIKCPACGQVLIAPTANQVMGQPKKIAQAAPPDSGASQKVAGTSTFPHPAVARAKSPAPLPQSGQAAESPPWMQGTKRQIGTGKRLEEYLTNRMGRPIKVLAFETGRTGNLALGLIIFILLLPLWLVLAVFLIIPGVIYCGYRMFIEAAEARKMGFGSGIIVLHIVLFIVTLLLGGGLQGLALTIVILSLILPSYHCVLARVQDGVVLVRQMPAILFSIPIFGQVRTFPLAASLEIMATTRLRTILRFQSDGRTRVITVRRGGLFETPPDEIIDANLNLLSGKNIDPKLLINSPPTTNASGASEQRPLTAPNEKFGAGSSGGQPAATAPRRWFRRRNILIGGGILAFILGVWCGGFGNYIQKEIETKKKTVAEANELWDQGNQKEAVAKYKSVLLKNMSLVDKSKRPVILQRCIEFELANGETSSARQLMEAALDYAVPLAFRSPSTKKMLIEVTADWEASKSGGVLVDTEGELTKEDPRYDKPYAFVQGNPYKVYHIHLRKNRVVLIQMKSSEIDSFVLVEDSKRNVLAANDDDRSKPRGTTLDSALRWTAPLDGKYRVIASCYTELRGKYGDFHLTVRTSN